MGQFINKVKVKLDYDNGLDKNFIFTVAVESEADLIKTVNKGLQQKLKEGEFNSQNLRKVVITSDDDERGFFGTVVGDITDIVKGI